MLLKGGGDPLLSDGVLQAFSFDGTTNFENVQKDMLRYFRGFICENKKNIYIFFLLEKWGKYK